MVETHDTPILRLFVRRSFRLLQQPEENTATSTSSSTINRLSLAAIVLVPLLLFIIIFMCVIIYCYYIPYVQYKDQKHQYRCKTDSNTTTLDHHSDGGNGSDSTEADDSLNDTNPQIIQGIEIDSDELIVIEENRHSVVSSAKVSPVLASQSSLNGMEHPMMTTLHRRPSYSQTLEETLLQYGNDTVTINIEPIKTNVLDGSNDENDIDDDNQTTTTNGPICIDDGTSYDGNDDSDGEDSSGDYGGGGGIISKIRTDAHSPIDEILIFSDVENSSDDEDTTNNDDDDDEASLSQRLHENDPYGRYYRSYPAGGTTADHRWAGTTSTGGATSLLALLNFDSETKRDTTHYSANIFKSFTSTQSTKSALDKVDTPKDDTQQSNSLTKRPSLRRNCSVSSTSSSLYDDIEEQAWIEFQQQSFDNGDTQTFPYHQPPQLSTPTSLSSLSSKTILSLPQIRIEDDDDYYSERMDNVRSLDCKNIGNNNNNNNNNNNALVLQYDDLQRQRQLWDRIQHLPLSQMSSSSSSLSTKKQSPLPPASSHIARQKVEL